MHEGVATRDARWEAVQPNKAHPLGHFIDARLGAYVLRLLEGPRSRFGAPYFRLHLADSAGRLSSEPILIGLYGRGRHPSQNWIEIAGASAVASFPPGQTVPIDPLTTEIGKHVWQMLGDSVPPGGHLMVEYESREWRESAQALTQGVPPVATPLGYLLFLIGCGVNFKDWYFSEGLHEGPRKLQGWKALDDDHRRRRTAEMIADLEKYLALPASASIIDRHAHHRARFVLSALKDHPDELPRLARAG